MVRPPRFRSLVFLSSVVVSLFLVVCVAGCGPAGGSASLSGKVTFDGQPIEEGNIRLLPTGEGNSQGGAAPIVNGSYEIPASTGLGPGNYTVVITATRPATPAEISAMKSADDESGKKAEEDVDEDEQAGAVGGTQPSTPKVQYIPKQFNQTSTLTVEVKAGENSQDFDLKP